MTKAKEGPKAQSEKPKAAKKVMAKKTSEEKVVKKPAKKTEPKVEKAKKAETSVAKAGKRSAKALKEAEEKQAKEERKTETDKQKAQEKPKPAQKPPRSRLERRGKKYRELAKQIDKNKEHSLKEAIELAVKTNPAKFDASIEMHFRLGVDPKQSDQNIRDSVILPAGSGKKVRVAVFGDGSQVSAAKKAGA